MRRIGGIALCLFIVSPVLARAADDDPKAIINKSIKAIGGEEKMAKFKAQTFKEKGTYYGMGAGQPYTGNYAVQFPDKFKMEIEGVFTIVLNGDKGWMNGQELTKEQLAEQQEELYSGWVATLAPLGDKAFTLAPLGETKVDNKPAAGVKVSSKGHGDVNLYFDNATGFLVKIERRAKAQEQGGQEVSQETFFQDYKDVDGLKVPMKMAIKRGGKQFVESEVTELKPVGKLDDSVFAKP
jgi:outer membrane lipoprotein-sorting protein